MEKTKMESLQAIERTPVKPTPVKRTPVTDQVVDQLRRYIERGGLKSGDRLPSEMQLSKRLGVSRNVLREAVGRLQSLGMVRVHRGRGMFVGDRDGLAVCANLARTALAVSGGDLTQVAQLRVAVESYAARQAAELATPRQVEELQAAEEKIGREGLSYEESIRADWAFHMKVIEIGSGRLLLNLMTVIQEFLIVGIIMEDPGTDRFDRMHSHDALVDGIRGGDPTKAELAVREHLEPWVKRLLGHFPGGRSTVDGKEER